MYSLFKNWYYRHFSQPGTVEFALVLIAAFLVIYYFMWLVGPIVVALCLAYCLDWGVRALTRRFGLSRPVASTVVMILFIGFAASIILLLLPRVIKQGTDFYNSVAYYSAETTQSQSTEGGNGDSAFQMSANDLDYAIARNIEELVNKMPDPIPGMFTFEEIESGVNSVHQSLLNNIAQIMRNQIMPSVVNAFTWLMYMIIVPIFMYLMLMNKHVLQRRMRTYILPNNQVLIHEFWPKINSQIEGYIRGKLIHIVIISIVNTSSFLVFGLNYAFLLGIGVGLSVVIPYVGAILIAIPVLLISVLQFGFSSTFAWLWAVYILIQLLDSNILTPMLFSKAMNLDAFSILAAILIFGGLWGFWGVFFSIPLATFISTLIVYWPNADATKPKLEMKK
ncbi:MAG: AI-2E family transporter [Succinivibrio sp.]|nr:AI-2E family transporter [Succinivibrio sp.]